MIDGDALWRSDKLAQVQPPEFRAEYANLIPLALADGTFECNPRRVWADVYSYNRPDIDVHLVEKILNEFESVGLLTRIEKNGKIWGYWNGIESRLPSESTRDRYKNGVGEVVKSQLVRERCVYFVQDSESGFVKIGFCYFDRLRARIKEIQTGTPGRLVVLGVIRDAKRGLENDLHQKWMQYQTNSESEWFKNHHDIIKYIEENSEDVDFTEVTFHKNQSNTAPIPNTHHADIMTGLDRIGLDKDKIGEQSKPDFQNLRTEYRKAIGKSCSNSSKNEKWYLNITKDYSESDVLSAFNLWAEEESWRDKKPDLYFFFSDISRWVEAAKADKKLEETTINESEVERINREGNEQARLEAEKRAAKIREDEAAAEELKAHPFEC